jgi:hypothetical protein
LTSGVQQNSVCRGKDAGTRSDLARSPPAFIAAIFGILGLAAIWGIRKNITTGAASSRGRTCTLDDNPVGFCLFISMRAAIVGFAIAEILYGFGLVGDPVAQIKHALPFLS